MLAWQENGSPGVCEAVVAVSGAYEYWIFEHPARGFWTVSVSRDDVDDRGGLPEVRVVPDRYAGQCVAEEWAADLAE